MLALHSAASGMRAQQLNLDCIANDLANVNTTGYKGTRNEFEDVLYQTIKPAGGDVGNGNLTPVGLQIGHGTCLASTTKIFTQGDTIQTDGFWDVAVQGNGFLEVEMPDGTSAYTRDGALKIDSNGQITTKNGFLFKNLGTVPSNWQTVTISETGYVTVKTPSSKVEFQIPLVRFSNPAGLMDVGNNLCVETDASGSPESGNPGDDGFGKLRQGALEGSNVNAVEAMVEMIKAQRAYELNSKSVQTADDMLSQVNQLKR